ncbi:MspA family porin [Mycobacterium sp. IDR2000157661]|uniref:MspA family porin n=1 Tax=Mycobacterium sp. IDR2000157661 TaxID=2867005 RepID=UPI001EEE1B78|nr:MspA family porin [Mycobacterium sp. IDR2000157661]ULE35756.1 MspA family porin [Mycobacterium sp. IDR2000157661]
MSGLLAERAAAQPEPGPVAADAAAEATALPPDGAPPPPEGAVASTPPAVTETPDGWTLTLSAKDETQAPIPPLTTAVSSREYVVGGTYTGAMSGPGEGTPPEGTLEVGYEIGCGIDMSTSNGVALTGTAGINPSIGLFGTDFISPFPEGLVPGLGGNIGGAITVGLKPGIINVVPVTKKEFTGADPWVMVSGFRVKIDGCVGESFIRSYAFLTRSTDMSEAVLAWYGVTKKI